MTERSVNYRAVHTKTAWRKVRGHRSLESALRGMKDGAPGLFARRVRIDYSKHGDPLYVVIWEDGALVGYVVKPNSGSSTGTMQVEIPVAVIQAYEARGGASPADLETHFTRGARPEPSAESSSQANGNETLSTSAQAAEADEGGEAIRTHVERERDPALAAKKRALVLRSEGKLSCEACGFDFAVAYGEIGAGFCEVHHLRPIGARTGSETTSLDDLAVVCSNCHSIIHRTKPMWSVAQLAAHLKHRHS